MQSQEFCSFDRFSSHIDQVFCFHCHNGNHGKVWKLKLYLCATLRHIWRMLSNNYSHASFDHPKLVKLLVAITWLPKVSIWWRLAILKELKTSWYFSIFMANSMNRDCLLSESQTSFSFASRALLVKSKKHSSWYWFSHFYTLNLKWDSCIAAMWFHQDFRP